MIQEEMKLGPKGQIVIPKAMRRALKIGPGSRVLVTLSEGQVIIRKPVESAVSVFESVARNGVSVGVVEPHLYEEELHRRIRP
jgi:AbrB family looped-hinge helix DNA binding protein